MTKDLLHKRVQEGTLLTRVTEQDWISPRDSWGEGPWTTEPDEDAFEHLGFRCVVLRGRFGSFSGFVAVPPGHPWHGKEHDDVEAPVHRGLSFHVAAWESSINEVHFGDTENRDHWWIGFDASRMGDFSPALFVFDRKLIDPIIGEADPLSPTPASYRTFGFMREQTIALAEEAARVAEAEAP